MTPRLKTHIRVAAHIHRAQAGGAFATIVARGDPDAGAIAVKLYSGAGRARLFMETRNEAGDMVWRSVFDAETDEPSVDARLRRERDFDRDLWIVEIEDRAGRAFLSDDGSSPDAGT